MRATAGDVRFTDGVATISNVLLLHFDAVGE